MVTYPGRLIIVEGIDGSGKSTQLELLRKWLVNRGYLVRSSEWSSSPIVKAMTRLGMRKHLLSPMSFSLIHAADFASRTYAEILPALQAGTIVLADRYVYTAYARDGVRGVSRNWLRRLVAQQQRMRELVRPYLDGAVRAPQTTLGEPLHAVGLPRHHLAERRLEAAR